MKISLIMLIFVSLGALFSAGGEAEWVEMFNDITLNQKITCFDINDNSGEVYVCTNRGVYIGNIFDRSMRKLETRINPSKIRFIISNHDNMYFYTTDNDLYLLSGKDLVLSEFNIPLDSVNGIAVTGESVWAASRGDLFHSADKGITWKKYNLTYSSEEIDSGGYEESQKNEGIKSLHSVENGGVVLTVNRKVYVVGKDTFGWEMTPDRLVDAIMVREDVLVATRDKIFVKRENRWETIFENKSGNDIIGIRDDGKHLYVVTERGIYVGANNYSPLHPLSITHHPSQAYSVPSINEVQQKAIEYAEVSPEKIISWRKRARLKGVLPKVRLSYSRSCDDNVEIYKSASTNYTIIGPKEYGDDWGVDISWDLSELVWSGDDTTIDVRSKLMVQLREDILEQVTRLYYERRRIMREINGQKRKENFSDSEKYIRLEEITAQIDAYTGGWFSREQL